MKRRLYDIELSGHGKASKLINEMVKNNKKVSKVEYVDGSIWLTTDIKGLRFIRTNRRRFYVTVHIDRLGEDTPMDRLFYSWAVLLFCFIPFFASLFLWQINVDAEYPEIAEQIEKTLKKDDVTPMKLMRNLPDEGKIRSNIMSDEPKLSWVRFVKKGTTLTIIPMVSPNANFEVQQHEEVGELAARTGGVITGFQLESGEPVARRNQSVKKGDLLASGVLEQGEKVAIVGADGKVFADYWLEYHFSLPTTIDYRVAGDTKMIVDWYFPWSEAKEKNRPFWKIVEWREEKNSSVKTITLKEGMDKSFLIPLVKHKLLSETSVEKEIKDENILQVTFDSDKVTGTILFLINENIAVKRPISQRGDD